MSKELRDIAAASRESARRGLPCALATVVSVEGSSFRRPGARMLVGSRGEILAGCVSGGCLEADVVEWALRVIAAGRPKLLTYDTRHGEADEAMLLGVGTGCDGIIDVLVEPLPSDASEPVALPLGPIARDRSGILATIYRCEHDPALVGARRLVDDSGQISGSLQERVNASSLVAEARARMERFSPGNSSIRIADGFADVFFELVQPPPRIVICGCGPDALPLARMAAMLGWRIAAADHRPAYAAVDRFPSGAEIVVARPEELLDRMSIDARSACVLMTHNYLHDRALLALLSGTEAFYVGLLGARKRIGTLIADLLGEGCDARARLGGRLHAPVGLDIGATDPDTIALSIVAEIQAALSGSAGGPLNDGHVDMQRSEGERERCPALA